ncbi:MAG: response regulator [Armatimonadota bacterium]
MPNKVMIVDDALFMRVSIRKIITGAGYDVVAEAGDGNEAVRLYEVSKPDAVLMDITMPGKDGLTAAKEILLNYPDAKIIMCTALGQQNMLAEAIKAGVRDYIVKPFQPERVIESLAKVLE